MSQLAKLQADFQAYIYDNVKGENFKQQIVNDKKVGATKRLGIYSDGYRLRIIEALENTYPDLNALLGCEAFEQIARSYIEQYPSTHRNMRWVGDQMQAHLTQVLPQQPIAAEMAAFEWALGLAFDAEDLAILQIQDLAAIPPETWGELRFKFHPSVQLFDFQWNVVPVWQALENDKTPPKPKEIKEPCAVWRNGLDSHFRTIDSIEYAAIEQVMSGISFEELCVSLAEHDSDTAAQQAANYLAGWINEGMLLKTI